jgi:hypothetical protein
MFHKKKFTSKLIKSNAILAFLQISWQDKSKSGPVTCNGGALDERRYSSYSFLTLALEWGESSASRPGRALPPGKEPTVPTV